MRTQNQKGFSLLEVMLVLALLGGIATLAMSQLPGSPAFQQYHEKLKNQMAWVAERAGREGQIYGLAVSATEWRWVKLVRHSEDALQDSYYWPGHYWRAIEPPSLDKTYSLPAGTQLTLALEGHEFPLLPMLQQQGLEPRILFFPGGDISHFVMWLQADGQTSPPLSPESLREM